MAGPGLGEDLDRIRAALGPTAAVRPRPPASAVLIPLVQDADGLHLLLTVRAADLSMHPGELSFPGGRIEPTDASPLAAALRETEEETGLRPRDITPSGHLGDYETFRRTCVAAFVGTLEAAQVPDPPPPTAEVEEVLLVPLRRFWSETEPARPHAHPGRSAHPWPVHRCDVVDYHGRVLAEPSGGDRIIHYWRLRDGHTLWGISADLLALLLSKAFGWRPTGTPRRLRSHDEVRP